MSQAIGIVAFVVALLASVMLHEAGHFATARAFGMKASRFFVGFGPTLWSVRRGETEYGVKAIPAGGFVKIVGMTPLEEVDPGDEGRAFYRFPARQRAVVLSAGSAVHFLLAVLITFGVVATFGDLTRPQLTLTVGQVLPCVHTSSTTSGACGPTDQVSPAMGVLDAGDRIVAVNGQRAASFDSVRSVLQHSIGQPVTLTLEHGGRTRTVTVSPAPVEQDGKVVGQIGFVPKVAPKRTGVLGAVPVTFGVMGRFWDGTVQGLSRLPGEVPKILNNQPRGANDPGSVVDLARVSGDIASTDTSVSARVASFLLLVAGLNFFVGVFNLFPLLPLDGGHLAIVGFESARSRLYRLVGRRDPGRVDLMKIMPFTYAVVAVIIGVALLLLYAGIVNPIRVQ